MIEFKLKQRWKAVVENTSTLTIEGHNYANETLADFEAANEVGRGSFGIVSRCRFQGADIAVKVPMNCKQ
jgi:hypothetical protein